MNVIMVNNEPKYYGTLLWLDGLMIRQGSAMNETLLLVY